MFPIPLGLDDAATNLEQFARVRASSDGSDTVVWFAGDVHAFIQGERARHLFAFEGFNIARVDWTEGADPGSGGGVRGADDGWDLLSREAVFYLDPTTREVLRTWTNPFTDREVEVVHVWNDPVNFPFRVEGRFGPWSLPVTALGDRLVFTSDIFLTYPSPLPRADFPEHSQSDLYQAAELFQYFVSRADLEGGAPSVPADISWTRIAPWVPFMAMADRPGHLVYHCQGTKLGAYDDLPAWIRDEVARDNPGYAQAPTEFSQPSETSWTYFRRLAGVQGAVGDRAGVTA